MPKKYNNNSRYFRNWTNDKLKSEAQAYHQSIHVIECYGTKDIMALDGILKEIESRGIEVSTSLGFSE